jgi:hypothetical protein
VSENDRKAPHAHLDALIAAAGPPPGTWEVTGPPRTPASRPGQKRWGSRIAPDQFSFYWAVYKEHHAG